MSRQEILNEIREAYGFVPGFFTLLPDVALEQWWSELGWQQSDSVLSARDKVLVSFGAAAALHCEY